MKRVLLWILVMTLFFVGGCKQVLPEEDAVAGDLVLDQMRPEKEQGDQEAPEEEQGAKDTPKEEQGDKGASKEEQGDQDTPKQEQGDQDTPKKEQGDTEEKTPADQPSAEGTEQYECELRRTYDVSLYKEYWEKLEKTWKQLNSPHIVYPDHTFTKLMSDIRDDGLVVAGYIEGKQEEYRPVEMAPPGTSYVVSEFTVTDVYHGKKVEKIRIREPYIIMETEQGTQSVGISDGDQNIVPGRQMLVFLKKNRGTDTYSRVFHPMYLTEDYRDYSESYLTELLNYYRGDPSAYPADSVSAKAPEHYIVECDENGNEIKTLIESADRFGKTVRWTEREISDKALLEEMKEHILVRAAEEFKIALWPTQHIRYTAPSFTTAHRDLGLESYWQATQK